MDNAKAKVLIGKDEEAKRRQAAGQEQGSLVGWLKKKLRRIVNRRKRDNDIEIYPLF
jgi:hypothetical protein